ncbi:hypothetical protein EKO27_g7165 [Xylaria grammica]|uniref:Uncharacterized protein n=1 Tax=Xylaria grammica TaxID=363999 RepID=A0A439D0G3_9PEZI|nr:hypothetical protein EKO27_g7165 [Xylaria grammica]
MQPTLLLALISTAVLSSLPAGVLAAPTEPSQPDPALQTRQYYDGPCSHTECGATRVNCRDIRLWCVAYPSFSQPEGYEGWGVEGPRTRSD